MSERKTAKYILFGFKRSFYYSLIAVVVLSAIALIYSLARHVPALKSMAYANYYVGGIALLISIPYLYKRDELPNITRIRRMSPIYGFQELLFPNPYTEKAMMESIEEFKGEGFWVGIFIIYFSIMLFLYGFIFEKIFYLRG